MSTCAHGELEGLGEEETQSQDYQPASGAESGCRPRVWHTPECLPPRQPRASVEQPIPAGASCSYSPFCPPALPTVSATPGNHMPCGNLTSLVLPSEKTAGTWGLGDRGGVGNGALARKQEQLWQGRERLAASTCCVTLGSLSGLSGLGLLLATGSWSSRINYRQLVASWAHLLMPGTAHWRPQGAAESFTPRPECWGLTFSMIPGQCLGFLINTLRGLVAGMACRRHFPPAPGGWSQQPRPPPACSPKAPTFLNGHFVSCQRTAVCSAAPAPETSR